jgi:hypothetical protein
MDTDKTTPERRSSIAAVGEGRGFARESRKVHSTPRLIRIHPRPSAVPTPCQIFLFAASDISVNNRGMTIAKNHRTGVTGRDFRIPTAPSPSVPH